MASGPQQFWRLNRPTSRSGISFQSYVNHRNGHLTEFTQHRGDLAALLQPRPKLLRPSPQISTPSSKGGKPSKGSGKGGKSQKGGKSSVRWISEIWRGTQKKTLCMRYQLGKCSNKDCRYEHACGYPKPDGSACGGSHPATEHDRTPH